jgi:hypothetical protein
MGWVIKEDSNGNRYPEYVEEEQPTEVIEKPVTKPTLFKEFHKVDLTTGERLDVLLIDVNNEGIPEDCKLGWGEGFYNPKWDFELNRWVEGVTLAEIIEPMRQAKVSELNSQCTKAIETGFTFNGHFFQFNEKDQANFNQQLSLLLLDETVTEVQWKTENNGVQLLTRQQFIDTCKAGEVHKRNNIGHYWQLKQYVLTNDFETTEELQAINFDFVIPTETGTTTGTDTSV